MERRPAGGCTWPGEDCEPEGISTERPNTEQQREQRSEKTEQNIQGVGQPGNRNHA